MVIIEAEIVKIAWNGFITTKISYANMISDLCDNLGADKYKVLETIGIGNRYFNPGYWFGGPCYPRDTIVLHLAEQNNIISNILIATTKYSNEHIKYQINQLLKNSITLYYW